MKGFQIVLFFLLIPIFILSQDRYDVVIDEIMADPSPKVGLPDNEWIELRNTTSSSINLQGWYLGDISGQSGAFPNFILQADSLVIVCTGSALTAMSSFGTAFSVTSFPSLGNDGDQIFLRAGNGNIIHAVAYSGGWYQNELKNEGGWTLEMIDTKNPCSGSSNWNASTNPLGGTPGKKNSIDGINQDQTAPTLKYSYTIDSVTLIAVFDEPLDSLKASDISNYSIDGGLSVLLATSLTPLFNTVQLRLSGALLTNTIYHLIVSNVFDCSSNVIGSVNTVKAGLPQEPSSMDIVINEILFNPTANGYDYIEYFDRSDKIINAAGLFAANRNSSGVISSIDQIGLTPFYIFPGEYFVITENAASIKINYLVNNPGALLELPAMPSYPDDAGDVILLNGQGDVVDEVKYNAGWQFKLIDNAEGVSLERIDPDAISQVDANWHSAASTAGYGTPGYKNSQYKQSQIIDAIVNVVPKIFSPDNDGHDDVTSIQYKVTAPGYVVNITIFDSQGRPVRDLVKNGTLGLNGQWNWDGLDEKGNKLAIGIYIIYTDMFNLQGKKQQFKNTVVLAKKFN